MDALIFNLGNPRMKLFSFDSLIIISEEPVVSSSTFGWGKMKMTDGSGKVDSLVKYPVFSNFSRKLFQLSCTKRFFLFGIYE